MLAVLAMIGAIWSFLLLTSSLHRTLDQQVRNVGLQLKCPVCQGESVADSTSSIAQGMRANIREQLQAGKSEQKVIQFFADHYGAQIVWSPPWQGLALLAWLVPIALLLGGALLILLLARDWRKNSHVSMKGVTAVEDERELAGMDEAEYERYRVRLEQELADDDPLFTQRRTEVG
jgi:cytochrome c-type biogenesis protein CcmH